MSHWYMFDNHTFKRLSDNPIQAVEEAMECFDKDPCGSVFTKSKAFTSFGVHGRGRGTGERFRKDLEQWAQNLIQNHYSKGAGI